MKDSEKTIEETTEAIDEEVKIFVLHEHKVTTINGEHISIPRCSWGKEMKILALLKGIVKAVIESGVLGGANATKIDPALLQQATQAQLRIQNAQENEEEPDPADLAALAEVNQQLAADNVRTIAMVTEEIFANGPEALTEAVMVLMNREREWVENNLESEEMLGLVIPFLYAKRQTIGKVLGRFTAGMMNAA